MAEKAYLAIDMGASSGRHVVGRFDGDKLKLEEIYRFANGPVEVAGSLHWDILGLWSNVREGLCAAGRSGNPIVSVGADTWGVDFGLLGRGDTLLGTPYHYRDSRTDNLMEEAFKTCSKELIFEKTGLQFLQFNSLYQLLAMKKCDSPLLEMSQSMLLMADLFHWLLTGEKCNEMTLASTSQLYNPSERGWATDLADSFGIPSEIFGTICQPGTNLGPMRREIREESGLAADVVLPGSHDTASAVMAVPATSCLGTGPDWCYISLGTWALMGIESPCPMVNDKVMQLGFTNEGGVGETIRLLKNIAGMWVIQECRRRWNRDGRNLDWEDLNRMSASAAPLVSFIDPDAQMFLAPTDMPEAIRQYCRDSGQPVPESDGAVLRCALESLAMKFRQVLGMCETLAEGRLKTIHIVGGGTQNRQLCQAAADACGRRVVAGPVEATAIGNIMTQAVAAGDVGSIAEAREVIRGSFEVEQYDPAETSAWNDAYQKYLNVLG